MKVTLPLTLATVLLATSSHAALVGLWQFEGDTADGSGLGNNGTLQNGASLAADVPAGIGSTQSLAVGGGTQHVLVPDSSSLSISSTITISAWAKGSGTSWDGIVAKSPGAGSPANHAGNYELRAADGSHQMQFLYELDAAASTQTKTGPGAILGTNEWTHIAVTAVAGADIKFYVDGTLTDTVTFPEASFSTNSNPLYIGSRADLFTTHDGWLDDVAIFDEALSADQINTIKSGDFSEFAGAIPEPSSSLLALFGASLLALRRRR